MGDIYSQKKRPPEQLQYFTGWHFIGSSTPPFFEAGIRTQPILSYRGKYRLMIACLWPNNRIDFLDETKLAKSNFFEIAGDGENFIAVDLNPEFTKPMTGKRGNLQCFLYLVPRDVAVADVQNLRQLQSQGGWLLAAVGVTASIAPE